MLLDLSARGFNQFAILDSRWTRGLARAAIEATVDVRDEGIAERKPAFVDQLHLADSPARRIRFLSPQLVGRAVIQAKPAVDTARVVRVLGLVSAVEAAGGG